MTMKRTLTVLLTCLIAGSFGPSIALAAPTASVTLTGPGRAVVGQTFQVIASVTGAKDLDTVRLNGTFTPGIVEMQQMFPQALKSISPGNYTNQTTGIYSFGSFSVTDRVNGKANLAVFVFRAKKVGTAVITLGNDSLILSGGNPQPASFNKILVQIVEPSAQEQKSDLLFGLTSPTHPDGIGWRNLRRVEALLDIKNTKRAYIGFDRSPDGPTPTEVTSTDVFFTADADGIWYVHLGGVFADGTYVKKTLMALIDTEDPRPFEASADQTGVPADVPNSLRFAALDDTSGVDHYDIRLSNGFATTTADDFLPLDQLALAPGDYVAKVSAVDRAGNAASSEVRFNVAKPFAEELPQPTPAPSSKLIDWLYLIGILSLIVSLIFFYLGYHRRRRRRLEQSTRG